VAAVVSAAGMPFIGSLAIFLVISMILLAALRPLARSHRRMPPSLRTGTAALVGRPATVVERIVNQEGVGTVKIDGEVWTARSYMDDETYEAGTRVQVVEIRGATALVTED
jgi:membrane protein implicated in regulation of membrane protease activity